jgi:hypothetical protein
VELSFTSDSTFRYQPQDLALQATFQGPEGQEIDIAGFWDGTNRFLVRFAPPTTGMWQYQTVSSDTTLTNLHDQTGTVEVSAYTGDDPFAIHGWLEVSDNGRFLTYEDDTPYFYLGDTAWEISWKSYKDRVTRYLDNREKKGFNAIQMVLMSHQRLQAHGVRNRYGEPFFENESFSRINPRYFDYVDWIVGEINNRGMMAVLVPLWAYMMELYPESGPRLKVSEEQALSLARYTGARYAGHNVLWLVGGDNKYDTTARKNFWDRFARVLDDASGRQHLLTVHPMGFRASYDYFSAELTNWLDFHSYQSSHIAGGNFTWRGAQRGYNLKPAVPVLNVEATYEDIHHQFWAPGDTTAANTFRIRPVHVRQASYESILSGALVGMAYGGNGIWQWNTEELPGSHNPRYTVEEAWAMPGSEDMGLLKTIMRRIKWYRLRPSQDVLVRTTSSGHIAAAVSDEKLATYLPEQTKYVTIDLSDLGPVAAYHWIDPASGDTLNSRSYTTSTAVPLAFTPPDTTDWLFTATATPDRPINQSGESSFESLGNAPNPFSSTTDLRFESTVSGKIHITVWNLMGQKVEEQVVSSQSGDIRVPVQVKQSGVYVYRAVFTSVRGTRTVRRGKMMALSL